MSLIGITSFEWSPMSTSHPLQGIRVLSLEQAAALPFATRHLADLGAEVIRVQSHRRPPGGLADGDLTRNKLQLAIDLGTDGGPEAFRRVAAQCDVVMHNFTPRVVAKYGIDFESIRQVNPSVVYASITGFGATGPWGGRPLFGPGAEAVSGHNDLIGDSERWPGRPGTIVYADNTAGMTCTFAVLAALEERDRTGEPQCVDVSLYECAVSQLGPVLAETSLGARPGRAGNRDESFAVHDVFNAAGNDRHIAIAATDDQLDDLLRLTGAASTEGLTRVIATREPGELAQALQAAGIPAATVADASDLLGEASLWERGYYGIMERRGEAAGRYPHAGPAWGGGAALSMTEPHGLGSDNEYVLRDIAGLDGAEIAELKRSGAIGEAPLTPLALGARTPELRVERGELARVEDGPGTWAPHVEGGAGGARSQ